jgi:hypothetical protein
VSETAVEAIILAINAVGAGILVFVAQVIQPMMDVMDEHGFRIFLRDMARAAMTDPVSTTVATLPLVAMLIYFPMFGFHHIWFCAALFLWLVGSAITKVINMPIYEWAGESTHTASNEIRAKRKRLSAGNKARAWITLLSVALMSCQFAPSLTAAALVGSSALAIPLTVLARRYQPGAK